jgi:hypothetical protein
VGDNRVDALVVKILLSKDPIHRRHFGHILPAASSAPIARSV